MTDEIKEEKTCKCCISPEYRQFLLTILAAFLGCLTALCLFSAVKPQTPPCPAPYIQGPCPIQMMHKPFNKHHFDGNKMHKHFEGKHFKHERPEK